MCTGTARVSYVSLTPKIYTDHWCSTSNPSSSPAHLQEKKHANASLQLLEAYETLKDPQKRAIHDAALLAQQERQRRYARPPYGNPTWAYREAQEAKRSRERAEAECAARAARDRAEAEERYRDSCAAREAHEKKQQLHRERQALWKAEHAKAHAFRQRYEAQKAEIGEANAFFKKQWQQHQRVERERGKKEGKTKRKKAERCPKAEPRMWGGTGEGWRTRGEWERGQ